MEVKSEYLMKLSSESRQRYEAKVKSAGLSIDPYSIGQLGGGTTYYSKCEVERYNIVYGRVGT